MGPLDEVPISDEDTGAQEEDGAWLAEDVAAEDALPDVPLNPDAGLLLETSIWLELRWDEPP